MNELFYVFYYNFKSSIDCTKHIHFPENFLSNSDEISIKDEPMFPSSDEEKVGCM